MPPSSALAGLPKKFEVIKKVGEGGGGACWLIKRKATAKPYVCKVERGSPKDGYSREIDMIELLQEDKREAPRVIEMFEYYIAPMHSQIILEYCSGGDLYSLIHRNHPGEGFCEKFLRNTFIQLAEALAYIHEGIIRVPGHSRSLPSRGWTPLIHRDIKPENVLMRHPCFHLNNPSRCTMPSIVLADFGLATTQLESEAISTAIYQPPELPRCSRAADVWGMGTIIHYMARGDRPVVPTPENMSEKEWLRKPQSHVAKEMPKRYSNNLNATMMACLERNPKHRISTTKLLDRVLDY